MRPSLSIASSVSEDATVRFPPILDIRVVSAFDPSGHYADVRCVPDATIQLSGVTTFQRNA